MGSGKFDRVESEIFYNIELFSNFMASDIGVLQAPKGNTDAALKALEYENKAMESLLRIFRTYEEQKKGMYDE